MAMLTVSDTCLRNGIWRGVIGASGEMADLPRIEATHMGEPLDGLRLVPDGESAERWLFTIPIPASSLSDGVQTFLLRAPDSGETLARLAFAAGSPLDEDISAELDLLRAELDLLKKAFRRHCVESSEV